MANTIQIRITSLIAKLDNLIATQISLIVLHPEYKALSARWIELLILCEAKEDDKIIKIKLLNITWQEIDKTINTSSEIDVSLLFKVIYEDQLGVSGGEPFNVLLGQYELNLQKISVLDTLDKLGQLCAYSLTPLLSNVAPETFALTSFSEIKNIDLLFNDVNLSAWEKLRKKSNLRFIGLLLPPTLLILEPQFHPNTAKLLNSNALYSNIFLTVNIIKSFRKTGWFNELIGKINFEEIENNLNKLFIYYARMHLSPELFLTNDDEKACIENGLIPLFKPNQHSTPWFNTAYVSLNQDNIVGILLEQILCACRIGHHIKLYARDKIGSYGNANDCENFLKNWLNRLTSNTISTNLRQAYPLKNFELKLMEIPGKLGYYRCIISLEPHMKLEHLNSKITLQSEIFYKK